MISQPFFFFFCLFQNVLTVQVPLPFHICFRIILSISSKNTPGIFTGMEINHWISVWRSEIFLILRLPIHEYGMSLKWFRFSFIILPIYQHFVVFSIKILYTVRLNLSISVWLELLPITELWLVFVCWPCSWWLCYIRLLVQSWFCCWHVCLF